jgi:F0F1-type ATP synthase assembly protein I
MLPTEPPDPTFSSSSSRRVIEAVAKSLLSSNLLIRLGLLRQGVLSTRLFNEARSGDFVAMRESDHNEPDSPEPESSERSRVGAAAAMAGTISGSVIGCLLAGYATGEYFDANPGAAIVGLAVGIVVGFYNLAKVMGLGK